MLIHHRLRVSFHTPWAQYCHILVALSIRAVIFSFTSGLLCGYAKITILYPKKVCFRSKNIIVHDRQIHILNFNV